MSHAAPKPSTNLTLVAQTASVPHQRCTLQRRFRELFQEKPVVILHEVIEHGDRARRTIFAHAWMWRRIFMEVRMRLVQRDAQLFGQATEGAGYAIQGNHHRRKNELACFKALQPTLQLRSIHRLPKTDAVTAVVFCSLQHLTKMSVKGKGILRIKLVAPGEVPTRLQAFQRVPHHHHEGELRIQLFAVEVLQCQRQVGMGWLSKAPGRTFRQWHKPEIVRMVISYHARFVCRCARRQFVHPIMA
mmetsp:Transcript_36116/g.78806  ORF Transcript_36116/g.78806 Transcript_36116/m.78806 type:complete len:245 (+) Transcript_36116:72-806(+)